MRITLLALVFASLAVVFATAGCGGGDASGGANLYSCDDIVTSSPAPNGDITLRHSCLEVTFNIPDPSSLMALINGDKAICTVGLRMNEMAIWAPQMCPRDSSLYQICDDPKSSAQSQVKDYSYLDTVNGKPQGEVPPLAPGCMAP